MAIRDSQAAEAVEAALEQIGREGGVELLGVDEDAYISALEVRQPIARVQWHLFHFSPTDACDPAAPHLLPQPFGSDDRWDAVEEIQGARMRDLQRRTAFATAVRSDVPCAPR